MQQEGVDNVVKLCSEYNILLDNHIYNIAEKFKYCDFDSKWYLDESILKFYLNKNKKEVIAYFQSCKNQYKKIAVWGAGKNGKILLDFLQINNIEIDELIDKNNKKQGQMVNRYVIKKPEDIFEKIQIIIISSRYIYNENIVSLEKEGIKIVNLEELVQRGYSY